MDLERYRFQKFISDIAGQDIKSHGNNPETVIRVVRDWLRNAVDHSGMPGGSHLWARCRQFTDDLAGMCEDAQLNPEHFTFTDFHQLVLEWISVDR